MARGGDYGPHERAAMMLSHQTLLGLEITARSTVECVKILLNAGADFVLTHKFNQGKDICLIKYLFWTKSH